MTYAGVSTWGYSEALPGFQPTGAKALLSIAGASVYEMPTFWASVSFHFVFVYYIFFLLFFLRKVILFIFIAVTITNVPI